MPPYDRYPAIDQNLELPPTVMQPNQAIALTTTARNSLPASRKWDGRQIYNTTLKRYERWDASGNIWRTLADQQDMSTLLDSAGTPTRLAATSARGSSNFAARGDHTHGGPQWLDFNISTPNIPKTQTFARLIRIGDMVTVRAQMTLTGPLQGPALIDPPIAFSAGQLFGEEVILGHARGLRSGVAWHHGFVCATVYVSVNRFGIFIPTGGGGQWTNGAPAAWVANDKFSVDFTYQCAP